MRRAAMLLAAVAAGLSLSSAAQADFVLFGERDPALAQQAKGDKFVRPISSPYFHEDAFVTTDVRAWYAYHKFGEDLLGGQAHVLAVQARLAITDTLQFVAYKDGWIQFDNTLDDNNGFNDIGAGLKWNFYKNYDTKLFASAGLGYEFAFGDPSVLQNTDDWRAFIAIAKGFGDFHFGATVNYYYQDGGNSLNGLPSISSNHSWSWHLHADYYAGPYFSPVIELNGYHWLDRGSDIAFSAIDVANIGGGGDEITVAAGGEFRPLKDNQNFGIRAAFEVPVRMDDDLLSLYGYRLTFSVNYEF